jgi:hypothetical protein
MTPNDVEALFNAFGIVSLLAACIPLLIALGLIIAVFQINSRVGDLVRLQQRTNTHMRETAEMQRQAFIAHLATHGPNHQAYLDYLVSQNQLTQDQAEFIAKQSGTI